LVERRHEEHGVDIGCDHLLGVARFAAGSAAGEFRGARQYSVDIGERFAGPLTDRDPVADRREIGAGGGLMQQPARARGGDCAVVGQNLVGALVLEGDARWHEASRVVGLESGREGRIPAERRKGHGKDRLEK
jgi:hypothetical protein